MNKIGVGIIGVGGVGQKVLEAFNELPNSYIVGICDTNEKILYQVSKRYTSIPICTNYLEVLQNENVDLVYIAVPPKYHYPIVMDALKNNKHVLCEKPLANSLKEAKEMWKTAEEKAVVHAMNFPTYYRNAYKTLNKIVTSNCLGSIQRIQVKSYFPEWPRGWQKNNWINTREQGGFIREIMPHYIQLIHHLFGYMKDLRSLVTYPEDSKVSETGLLATSRLDNGIPIIFDGLCGTAEKEEMEFTVYGSQAVVSLKDWNNIYFGEKNQALTKIGDENPINHLLDLVGNVLNAIKGQPATLVTFKEGYEIQKVLENLLHNYYGDEL
ncbi:Gfo/Idh/MocA family oxidoreductase [Bacillus sp. FJAT-49736]|uniref:Gfo/Idh/MocA family protein n=1 Tax=Bacillus sp. FJAT-49736 TaxID=2833582 RepID=UPI001BC8F677|nr:Gfo/Idh/MocA family oxidoreductase [Bacillus sp. FJAT-49736]MBS4172219.1 Gfo/Idh/MocA family oxidoreductase [Bacillus sp. FJAT-49736]